MHKIHTNCIPISYCTTLDLIRTLLCYNIETLRSTDRLWETDSTIVIIIIVYYARSSTEN